MKSLPNRTFWAMTLVSSLALILVTLAALQYRWSGQISQAEQERMQASLRTAVSQFREVFNRDLQQLCSTLQIEPPVLTSQDWQRYACSCDDSLSRSNVHLVDNVYLWIATNKGESQLMKLNREARSFEPVLWPSPLEVVHRRYAQTFLGSSRLPTEIRPFSWIMISSVPLLLQPLIALQPPALPAQEPPRVPWGPPPAHSAPPAMPNVHLMGYVLIELSMNFIRRELLPELAHRYFAGADGFIYQVAIVKGRDPAGAVIYQSDHNLAPSVFSSPDARISLLGEPWGPSGPREPGPESEARTQRGDYPRPPTIPIGPAPPRQGRGRGGAVLLPGNDGTDWELVVRHHQGSLEAVIASARRRNLIISFGILVLLASSMALIVAFAQRAHRLAQLQMDFVAGVSHELKTPLAVICSAADNLAEGVVADSISKVRQYGNLIRDEGRKLARIVEQILQFATLQNASKLYSLRPARIEEIIEKTLERALPALEAAGFQVEKSPTPNLPLVKVDEAALAQCLDNLIDNAMKYSGEDRWLAVRTGAVRGKQGTEVLITVEDRGMGIDSADLPHIFDPFYRGRRITAAQIHGTGLGLSLTNEAVAAMGGEISVRSVPGRGSSFTIQFPALPPDDSCASIDSKKS